MVTCEESCAPVHWSSKAVSPIAYYSDYLLTLFNSCNQPNKQPTQNTGGLLVARLLLQQGVGLLLDPHDRCGVFARHGHELASPSLQLRPRREPLVLARVRINIYTSMCAHGQGSSH